MKVVQDEQTVQSLVVSQSKPAVLEKSSSLVYQKNHNGRDSEIRTQLDLVSTDRRCDYRKVRHRILRSSTGSLKLAVLNLNRV